MAAQLHAKRRIGGRSPLLAGLLCALTSGACTGFGRCWSDDCPPPVDESEIFIDGEPAPGPLTSDADFLYWFSGNELRRAPLGGGRATTLATARGPSRLFVSGDHVYFTESAGTVSRIPREGGVLETIGSGLVPMDVVVGDDVVYWNNAGRSSADGTIARANLDGSDARELAQRLTGAGSLVVHDGFVYFTSGGGSCTRNPDDSVTCTNSGVHRVSIDGGDVELVASEGRSSHLVGNDSGLYWPVLEGGSPIVMYRPHEGAPEVLAALPQFTYEASLSLGSEQLYVTTKNEVLRIPLGGGTPVSLPRHFQDIGGIVEANSRLFVSEPSMNRIRVVGTGR